MAETKANPAPLGLLGFGLTTVLLNIHNAGLLGTDSMGMIMAMGIFYGGLAQVLAGVMEYKNGNTFGTTTGGKNIIRAEHMKIMKDGALLSNAGHFDNEIEKGFLEKSKKGRIRENVEEFIVGDKKLYLLAEGRLVNLVAGQGHPAEIMDMSFADQALGAEFLVKNKGKLQAKVYKIPEAMDREIAKLKLKSMGISIDSLSKEQKEYLEGWEEGT